MSSLFHRRPRLLTITSPLQKRRLQLIAATMLALTAVVFEVNGRAPGGVNLRPRDLSETVMVTGERLGSRLGSDSC